MVKQLLDLTNYDYNPHALPVMLAGVLIFFIGIFIFLQAKKNIKNISFFLFCMSSSLWLFTMGFVYFANNPQTALLWYKPFTFFGVANLTPNLYLFSVAASGFLKKQRVYVVATFVVTYVIYFLALTTDKFITMPTRYFWGYYPHYEPWNYLFLLTFAIVFFASQAHLKLAYKQEAVPIKRSQILTIRISLLFGFTAFFDFLAKIWAIPLYPFGFISMFILTCLLAYSIVKYKAFDIETVIHKTILWFFSFAIISVPILLSYWLVFPYMVKSTVAQMVFGLMSCVLFAIYMRLIQPRIDHFFQRRKANLEEISSEFAEKLVHLREVSHLVRQIKETIVNALYPQWVGIFIYNEKKKSYVIANRGNMENRLSEFSQRHGFLDWLQEKNEVVYRRFVAIDPKYSSIKDEAEDYFDKTGAMAVIPLVLNDALLGLINLDKKASLRRYNALDFHFLTTIKNQSAIAMSNSLIYQNIEEQVRLRTKDLVEAQEHLIQAEKLATVGTLSGGVAHEINNPLTAILTNVQMLLVFTEDGEAVDRESLELIEAATQRCRTIVQKLMAYSKKPVESDKMEEVNLGDALSRVVAFLKYQLEQDNIKIATEFEDGSHFVQGNHNELEQVITNIILNARDAIKQKKKNGCIHIFLSQKEGHVELKIQDEGDGIPTNVASKIFDPFFTTKDVGKGLGLGLSICQSIIEKHKGRITAESKSDKGAIFTIRLPQYSKVKEAYSASH